MPPLLEVKDLHTEFRTGAGVVPAVDGISYTVERGETVAIVGESGSGKTAGALSILRLIPDPPGRTTRGEILFAGRDLLRLSDEEIRQVRGSDIGMIFQEPMTSLNSGPDNRPADHRDNRAASRLIAPPRRSAPSNCSGWSARRCAA
jgi:ABC-type dipeptide/oligopeptide/nickel transport system ATPase component